MIFSDVILRLRRGLAEPLPAAAAQGRLAPMPRRPPFEHPAEIRNAAGLLLVIPVDRRPSIVLTERARTLERHGGQISLPGGGVDPGETFEHAALREAQEEIGLATNNVQVLGRLSPLDIPVSGFRLQPIVAMSATHPVFTASDGEVARILEIALDDLMHPASLATETRPRDGLAITVPFFRVSGVKIWGATAMILAEFLTVLGWKPPSAE